MALSPLGEFKVKLAVSSLAGLFAVSAVPDGSGLISTLRDIRNTSISQVFNPSFYRQHDLEQADRLRASVALGSVDEAFHARCERKLRAEFPDVFREEGVTSQSLGLGRFTDQCALAEAAFDAKMLENRAAPDSNFYTTRAATGAIINSAGLNGIPFIAAFGLMSVFFSTRRLRDEKKAAGAASADAPQGGSVHDCLHDGGSELCGPARSPAGPSHHR